MESGATCLAQGGSRLISPHVFVGATCLAQGGPICLAQTQISRSQAEGDMSDRDIRCVSLRQVPVSISERDMSLSARDVSLRQRCMSLGQRYVSLRQRYVSLSDRDTSLSGRDVSLSHLREFVLTHILLTPGAG